MRKTRQASQCFNLKPTRARYARKQICRLLPVTHHGPRQMMAMSMTWDIAR